MEEGRRSERYFRALIENANEVISVLDEDGVILYKSPAVKRVLGYSPEEMVGRSAFDFVHPDDLPRLEQAFRAVIATPGLALTVEYRARHRDGEWRVLASSGTNALDDPAIRGVAVSSRDVSARYAAEAQLRVQKAYFERLFESAPEGIVMLDTDDRVLHVNPEFTRMFGYSDDEARGRPINLLIAPESERERSRDITRRVAAGETVSEEATRCRKDGSPVEVSILGTPVELEGDRIGVFGIYRDITHRKETEARLAAQAEELRALSFTDDLTSLANRRGFFTLAEQRLKLARRARRRLVVIFIDVDDMKAINDAFGHAVGDQAIIDAANLLESTFRESDVMARVGGDEFAVLAWLEDGAATDALLDRLHENVDRHNTTADRPFTLSMSVGTAKQDPAHVVSLDDLLRHADADMYRAKRARDGASD